MRDLREVLRIRHPLIQAPMAGGPDTPALAAAVSNAGGLGSIGCGYSTAAQIEAAAAEIRKRSAGAFAINLFVRNDEHDDASAAARARPVLDAFRLELGLTAAATPSTEESFEAQLGAVLRVQPAVFSFTFGMPAPEQVAALRERNILVVGTATTVREAEALDALGVDAICAQGAEAGGHRGTFLGPYEDALIGTMALVPQLAKKVRVPVIAAGGIMDGHAIRAAMAIGASAVQLGTAFMACDEAGTNATHRAQLASPEALRTTITRAFSGRAARGIRNRFSDAFVDIAAAPFPQQQRLTKDLRAAAAKQGRADLMQLWAGQGAPLIRTGSAAELVATLMREAGQL